MALERFSMSSSRLSSANSSSVFARVSLACSIDVGAGGNSQLSTMARHGTQISQTPSARTRPCPNIRLAHVTMCKTRLNELLYLKVFLLIRVGDEALRVCVCEVACLRKVVVRRLAAPDLNPARPSPKVLRHLALLTAGGP
eukprot:scaffold44_cov411-Prasinococcus_capsulatus_cf.AAC.56